MILNNISDFEHKTFFVTGATGYLGSVLVENLSHINCNIILLQRDISRINPKKNITILQGDITSIDGWENIPQEVDYIIHLAQLEYDRNDFNSKKDFSINTEPIQLMFSVLKRKKIRPVKIIFASSSNIFGYDDNRIINDDCCPFPTSIWGIHKMCAEEYIKLLCLENNLTFTILRLSNIYGPSMSKELTLRVSLNKMIHEALTNFEIILKQNLKNHRNYIFIDDAINSILIALSNPILDNKKILATSHENKNFWEIAHLIKFKLEKYTFPDKINITIDKTGTLAPIDSRNVLFNPEYIRSKTSLETGIQMTINYFSKDSI